MFLIIRNADNVIEGTENIPSNLVHLVEDSYVDNGRYLIEIDENEFTKEMIGAIYDGGEEV